MQMPTIMPAVTVVIDVLPSLVIVVPTVVLVSLVINELELVIFSGLNV